MKESIKERKKLWKRIQRSMKRKDRQNERKY